MNLRIIWHMMPGDAERLIRKSVDIKPDAIIPCIEDGVAYEPAAKAAARELLVRLSQEIDWKAHDILFYPRVNRSNSEYWRDDIAVLMTGNCDGFVLAKEESPDRVRDVDQFIAAQEQKLGKPVGSTGLIVMVETVLGVHRCYDLAVACPRVEGILLGREDLSASLGIMRRHREMLAWKNEELLYARSKVVLECKAAGKEIIDGASFTYTDQEYMLHDSALAARMGFTGKLSAHPNHAKFIRQGFAPEPEDVAIAREMVKKTDAMIAQGIAPITAVGGMEVTPPVVAQARLVLTRAEWAGMLAAVGG